MQQLREAIPADHAYRFLIHDRDAIFSKQLDQCIRNVGLRVLQIPGHTPVANAICARVIGTLRQEVLDFVIPFTQHHVRRLTDRKIKRHFSATTSGTQPLKTVLVP